MPIRCPLAMAFGSQVSAVAAEVVAVAVSPHGMVTLPRENEALFETDCGGGGNLTGSSLEIGFVGLSTMTTTVLVGPDVPPLSTEDEEDDDVESFFFSVLRSGIVGTLFSLAGTGGGTSLMAYDK